VNRIYIAAIAIAATAAVAATPLFAQSGGNPPSNAATNPAATVPLAEGDQSAGAPPMHGRWGMGQGMRQGMQQGGPGAMPWKMMMEHGGMRRMMGRSPQAWCIERLARRAGLRAYVETKLNLTPPQMPLWRKVQDAADSETQQERQLCGAIKAGAPSTLLDRLDRREQFLSVRLAGLKAVKPALQALYNALTPEQKQILDHPFGMR
jgi:hypothetical protein